MTINKSVLRAWIRILRSGTYKQGQGALCIKSGYCCLGVAAKEFGYQGSMLEAYTHSSFLSSLLGSEVTTKISEFSGSETVEVYIPKDIRENHPDFRWREDQPCGVHILNDEDFTFDEIADCLEYTFLRKESRYANQ